MYQKWLSDSQNYVNIAINTPKDSKLDPFPTWGEFWESIIKPHKKQVPEHKRLLTEKEKQAILDRIKKAQSKRVVK